LLLLAVLLVEVIMLAVVELVDYVAQLQQQVAVVL
jgi:hypothetical protein